MSNEIIEVRAEKRAKALAKELSKAQAEDIANDRLRNVAAPMAGSSGGAGGGMTLERLFGLSQTEAYRWKKENPSAYDALVAEASTA